MYVCMSKCIKIWNVHVIAYIGGNKENKKQTTLSVGNKRRRSVGEKLSKEAKKQRRKEAKKDAGK